MLFRALVWVRLGRLWFSERFFCCRRAQVEKQPARSTMTGQTGSFADITARAQTPCTFLLRTGSPQQRTVLKSLPCLLLRQKELP